MERPHIIGPRPHFEVEVGEMAKKRRRLNLYFEEVSAGRFQIFLNRRTKITLAIAVPKDEIGVGFLQKQSQPTYTDVPRIPIDADNPTIENTALYLFSDFIPNTVAYAEGKTIDLYRVGRKKSRGLPDLRIGYNRKGTLTLTHPYQERQDSQKQGKKYPRGGNRAA